MLAMSVRVRPCSERCWPLSVGRLTSMTPSPTSTCISRGTRWVSSPLPLHCHDGVVVDELDAGGQRDGSFTDPRHVPSSPDEADHFATQAELARFGAGHKPA